MSPYCSPSDVASLNKARVMGAGNNPTASDVTGYINMIAGEIDAILTTKGYQVPIVTASNAQAANLLLMVNAKGAHWMMEEASATSPNLDRVKAAYDAALKMLSDAKFTLDTPVDMERGEVRAPFVTYTPPSGVYDPTVEQIGGVPGDGISGGACNTRRLPFFSRGLRF